MDLPACERVARRSRDGSAGLRADGEALSRWLCRLASGWRGALAMAMPACERMVKHSRDGSATCERMAKRSRDGSASVRADG